MPNPPTDEITTREALDLLGLNNPSTVIRMVHDGVLTPSRKLPGRTGSYLFWRSDVDRLVDERAAAKAAS